MTTYFVKPQYRMKTFKERWLSKPWRPWQTKTLALIGQGTRENPYSTIGQAITMSSGFKDDLVLIPKD